MSESLDPRITPARPDLAAASLRGKVEAGRFAEGTPHQVIVDAAALHFRPEADARLESQLLYGEVFTVYDTREGWCWGQSATDGYVGYVAAAALAREVTAPDHMVAALSLHLYPGPDLKLPPVGQIGLGSRVHVTDVDGGFCRIASGDWLFAKHLVPLDFVMPDLIGTALKFLGVPYLWGGRSWRGLDCSSLVQLTLQLAGRQAPRDSDMQAGSVGIEIPMQDSSDFRDVQEGDLVFFPGHVGFYVDGWRFLHANAFDMQVSLHRFSDVLDRAEAAGAPATGIRRVLGSD